MAIAGLLASVSLAAPPGPGDSWPQFRGDPALTGVSPITLPAPLAVVWTYEAGESIESSAAIAEGAVFVGRMGGELLSLALATVVGVGAWTLGHEAGAGDSPAQVTELQRQAFVRGVAAGAERSGRGVRSTAAA